ncbi:MAG: EamA family transporter [Caldilineaceae bacterium]|nr:EamA family transporter [Caldilineaceae bacterium]
MTFALYSIAGRRQRTRIAARLRRHGPPVRWSLVCAAESCPPSTPAQHSPAGRRQCRRPLALIPPRPRPHCFNAALRYLPATTVNVIATQEVTGGVLLGILLLGEMPSPSTLAGVVIALAGIFLVLR